MRGDPARLLPERAPRLRAARTSDLASLADWINRGRREGSFAGPPQVNAASLQRYFVRLERSVQRHVCLVFEGERRPLGYANFVAQGAHGELLGLYLEPQARGARLGSYVVRRAAAELRSWGCRTLRAQVFADNVPSLRACAAAGLARDPRRDTTHEGRRCHVLQRRLARLEATTAPYPSYAKLRGENCYLHHLTIADALASTFARRPGVEAVLGLGSLARGFADAFSDLDLGLIGRGLAAPPWRGERWICGVSVDLYAIDLERAPVRHWDPTRKQAFEESVVLHASAGFRLAPFRRALRLGARERREAVCERLFQIGWLGFAPRRWFGETVRNYRWISPHDLWLRRGSLASAHLTIDRAFEIALELRFLLDGRRPPDAKWRRYLLADLSRSPARSSTLLGEIERSARDPRGFERRAQALLTWIDELVREFERRGELPEDMYRSLLRVAPEYRSDL